MTIIPAITLIVIIVYLLYPVYLWFLPRYNQSSADADNPIPVSVILLTYNGEQYIESKISTIIEQLASLGESEFLVIDDNSTDSTGEILSNLKKEYNFSLILKPVHSGIPNSMNLAVKLAKYDTLIFCDQRQTFSGKIFKRLLTPFVNESTGAVSSLISCVDCVQQNSIIRQHENFIKKSEGRTGNLIGVYGPLFAIRKKCYEDIREDIILDDLALSLNVLKAKKIEIVNTCIITDESFTKLYNLNRIKRYLEGLLQILFSTRLLIDLPWKVKIMLIWHKYLRLLIPPLVVLSYLSIAFHSNTSVIAGISFLLISIIILISIPAIKFPFFKNSLALVNINCSYFISMINLFFVKIGKVVNPARDRN